MYVYMIQEMELHFMLKKMHGSIQYLKCYSADNSQFNY